MSKTKPTRLFPNDNKWVLKNARERHTVAAEIVKELIEVYKNLRKK